MGTKSDQISIKIRLLNENQQRVFQPTTTSQPSGFDFLSTLKFLEQSLISTLKDMEQSPNDDHWIKQRERERLAKMPTMNYSEIFHVVLSLYDVVPLLQHGQYELGQQLIATTNSLLCFLNRDLLDCLPYTVACVLPLWPLNLQSDLINMISFSLLPMTLGSSQYLDMPTYASTAIEAILALIFQYSGQPSVFSQITEACMRHQPDVCRSLLAIIATSNAAVKAIASNMLFHYYPQCKPHNVDSGFTYSAWRPPKCMNLACTQDDIHVLPTYYSFSPKLASTIAELPPPLYLCHKCFELCEIEDKKEFKVLPGPLENSLPKHCENPSCKAQNKSAVCLCFTNECIVKCFATKPVVLCQSCHTNQHGSSSVNHCVQNQLPSPFNSEDPHGQQLITEAIVKLLEEAEYCTAAAPVKPLKQKDQSTVIVSGPVVSPDQILNCVFETKECFTNEGGFVAYKDRRLLPRSAIWLINSVCSARISENDLEGQKKQLQQLGGPKAEFLGRLIAAVVHWFQCVFVQQNDSIGRSVEILKTEISDGWLTDMLNRYFDIFTTCLLPYPPEFARIGRHWDSLESATYQIRQGLHTIYCLMPYNVITPAVWSEVIPHWLDTVSTQVDSEDLPDLKFVFSKLFDQQMCAVFTVSELFSFLSPYFHCALATDQERALVWINTLSKLGVTIPLSIMTDVLTEGILSIKAQLVFRSENEAKFNSNTMWFSKETHLFPSDKSKVPQKVIAWIRRQQNNSDTTVDNQPAVATSSEGACVGGTSPNMESVGNRSNTCASSNEDDAEVETDCDRISVCFILMLDSLLKQSELQEFKAFQGLDTTYACAIVEMLNVMLTCCPVLGHHTCLNFTSPIDIPTSSSFGGQHAAPQRTSSNNPTCFRPQKAPASAPSVSTDPHLDDSSGDCDFCDEQAVFFELVFGLMQLLCPPTETKLSQLYVMEPEDFNAAIHTMLEESKSNRKQSFICEQTSSGDQKVKFNESENQTIPHSLPLVQGALPQICCWGAEMGENGDIINAGLIEFHASRSSSIVNGKTPQSTTHESEANQTVSNIRIIDDTNTEVHVPKVQPYYCWETSLGDFEYSPDTFPSKLKLLYIFIRYLREYIDVSAEFSVVKCLRLMLLHADTFSGTNYQQHLGFLVYLQEKFLLETFWTLIHGHESQTVQQSIPLILYGICQPLGLKKFWSIIQSSFTSKDWEIRFEAVEKVCAMVQFVDAKQVSKQTPIQSSLALCAVFVINSLVDENENVATRANIGLKSIRRSSLKFLCDCMEVQFESVIEDRPLLLSTFELLHNTIPSIPALSWEFFLRLFNILIAESQYEVSQGRNPVFPATPASSNETAAINADVSRDGKLDKAKLVRERSGAVLLQSVAQHFHQKSGKIDLKRTVSVTVGSSSSPNAGGAAPDPVPPASHVGAKFETLTQMSEALLQCNIHCSMFDLKYNDERASATGGSSTPYGKMSTDVDKETVHILISLLMKYISRPDPERPGTVSFENNVSGKAMSTVMRYLHYLLSYNPLDKSFFYPPHKLRTSVVLNAVMTHLAEMLDYNIQMGTTMMHMFLLLLQYVPSNRRIASSSGIGLPLLGCTPDYTLWLLEPHVRHQWLMAVLVILYKYRLDVSTQVQSVKNLIRITINTIAGQCHACQTLEKPPSPVVSHTVTPNMSRKNSKDILDQDELTEDVTAAHTETDSTAEDKSVTYPQIHHQTISPPTPQSLNPPGHKDSGGSGSILARPQKLMLSKISIKVSKHDDDFVEHGGEADWPNSGTADFYGDGAKGIDVLPASMLQQAKSSIVSNKDLHQEKSTLGNTSKGNTGGVVTAACGGSSPLRTRKKHSHGSNSAPKINSLGVDSNETSLREPKIVVEDGNQSDTGEIMDLANQEQRENCSENEEDDGGVRLSLHGYKNNCNSPSSKLRHRSSPDCSIGATLTVGATAVGGGAGNSEAKNALLRGNVGLVSSCSNVSTTCGKAELSNQSESKSPRRFFNRKDAKRNNNISLSTQQVGGGSGGLKEPLNNLLPFLSTNHSSSSVPIVGRRNSSFSISARFNEDEGAMVLKRCLDCKAAVEDFDEKTLSLSIAVLRTFVYRDPVGSAPFLLDVFVAVARLGREPLYNWQSDSKLWVRDTCFNVAKQFMRCTLHQLAPYGLFNQLFVTECVPKYLLAYIADCLSDFNELSLTDSLDLLLCNLNMRKTLPTENLMTLLNNLAVYMSHIHWDGCAISANLISHFDIFFKKLAPCMPLIHDVWPLFRIASILFRLEKVNGALAVLGKTQILLQSFGIVLSYILQASTFTLTQLFELMDAVKSPIYLLQYKMEKNEKLNNAWQNYLARIVCQELINGLKFKVNLPVENMVKLVQFAIIDLRSGTQDNHEWHSSNSPTGQHTSAASSHSVLLEVLRGGSYHSMFGDLFEFLGDIHTISKVRANARNMGMSSTTNPIGSSVASFNLGGSHNHHTSGHGGASGAGGNVQLHEDTLGGELKTGVAQIIACVLARDTVSNCKQFVPWLFNPPSTTQQGPKEFVECVGYVRMLSWLLLGSFTSFKLDGSVAAPLLSFPGSGSGNTSHSANKAGSAAVAGGVFRSLPPAECNSHIAEYILVLLTGFMEHNTGKSSILTMSALFHAFICCQLWTVYLEQLGGGADASVLETCVLEFWGKVTPGILQLLSLSKAYAETVVLHFLSLLEALQECNSTVLAKLLPMWKIIFCYSSEKMSSTSMVRLLNCENAAPPSVRKEDTKQNNNVIARWLNRLQFKISQVEIQTSNVSTTFLTL